MITLEKLLIQITNINNKYGFLNKEVQLPTGVSVTGRGYLMHTNLDDLEFDCPYKLQEALIELFKKSGIDMVTTHNDSKQPKPQSVPGFNPYMSQHQIHPGFTPYMNHDELIGSQSLNQFQSPYTHYESDLTKQLHGQNEIRKRQQENKQILQGMPVTKDKVFLYSFEALKVKKKETVIYNIYSKIMDSIENDPYVRERVIKVNTEYLEEVTKGLKSLGYPILKEQSFSTGISEIRTMY